MERENVVITGARRGLGKTLAYLFASKGYNLVINDKEDLDKLNEIKSYSFNIFWRYIERR